MIVVSDTSPLSALIRLGLIDLLPKVFGRIIIPPAVKTELEYLSIQGHDLSFFFEADWLIIKSPLDEALLRDLSLELDAGEIEAIVLAKELSARFLLIDEKKGRTIAQKLGVPIVGLLGVLLLAKRKGHLTEIRPTIIRLREIGFRISNDLANTVLNQADEKVI